MDLTSSRTTIRGCQDKYPISGATVIANKTTTSDIILPEQLRILTLWRPGHLIGGLFFFNGQSWTNILRHILDYIRILAGIRQKTRILTTPDTHTSSSHSTTSPWSPNPYPHCVFNKFRLDRRGGGGGRQRRREQAARLVPNHRGLEGERLGPKRAGGGAEPALAREAQRAVLR